LFWAVVVCEQSFWETLSLSLSLSVGACVCVGGGGGCVRACVCARKLR